MKILPITLLLICTWNIISAQEEDNKAYVKISFPKVYAAITASAVKEWPGDYDVQLYTIGLQCDDFYNYISLSSLRAGIPDKILREIKNKALTEWSKVETSVADAKCEELEGEKLLDCFYSTMNPDWTVVMFTINSQIESYKSLKE
jgi:hypothetical protein